LVEHAGRLSVRCRKARVGPESLAAVTAAMEFLRVYAGERSAFYSNLRVQAQKSMGSSALGSLAAETLLHFVRFVRDGLIGGASIVRQARADVVSDFLSQAQSQLATPNVHPAAAVMTVGAALEEYLRNWVEDADLKLGNRRPSLSAYAELLRQSDLISVQDLKDIVAWGGLRNHAAHGEWEKVSDRSRVELMLEGVNLFMRRCGEKHGDA
jgi:hypothetical protein